MAERDHAILVIEDNATDARILRRVLERARLGAVTVVEDGLEGLAAAFRLKPDALVLDLELPGIRGEEICRIIRSSMTLRNLPIVVVSELPDAKRREMELLQLGADTYLQKPFNGEALVGSLRRLFELAEDDTLKTSELPELPPAVPPPPTTVSGIPSPVKEATKAPTQSYLGPPTIEEPEGRMFQGYRLLDVLGAGGMGTVYRAEQMNLRRIVALKVLLEHLTKDDSTRRRFLREAVIMGQVNHPNIVAVYDVGNTEYTSYFAMEYVPGMTLHEAIAKRALEPADLPRIVDQTCHAISHLHGKGIIHRDIKPSNILMDENGTIKVTDFGISRAKLPVHLKAFEDATKEFVLVGTVNYMAPELLYGSPASALSDQYALGRTFWRMLVGVDAHQLDKSAHDLRPDVPVAVSDVIARALDPSQNRRFSNVEAFREKLVGALNEGF